MRIFITLAVAVLSSAASFAAVAAEKPADFARGRALVTANVAAAVTTADFVKTGTNVVRSAAFAVAPNWRYRFHRGEWWYWMPANYWTYYRDGNWLTYNPATYQPLSVVVTTPNYAPYADNGYYDNGYSGNGYYGNGYYGGYRYYRPYYGPGYSYYRYPGYRYGYYGNGYRPNYYSAYRGPAYRYGYGAGPYRNGYAGVRVGAPGVRVGTGRVGVRR